MNTILFRSRTRRLSRLGAFSTLAAALPLLLGTQPVRAATYSVSDPNWGTSTTTNSFAWALAQANANPGADTISIMPGLAIDVDDATDIISGGWLTTINNVPSFWPRPVNAMEIRWCIPKKRITGVT